MLFLVISVYQISSFSHLRKKLAAFIPSNSTTRITINIPFHPESILSPQLCRTIIKNMLAVNNIP